MILMFGDIHGNFDHILPAVLKEKPAAIIFLGDIQAHRPLEIELEKVMDLTEIYWIHGNHDTETNAEYENLFDSKLADKNLGGKVTEIDGLRVAGLGGVFREKSWYPKLNACEKPKFISYKALIDSEMQTEKWKRLRELKKLGQAPDDLPDPHLIGMALTHKSTIFYNEWVELFEKTADILVTHEAPTCHPHGFDAIDVLAQGMGVKKLFHGHHHDRLDYSEQFDRLKFDAYGVGFCGITDMNGNCIGIGKYDNKRIDRLNNEAVKYD